MMEDNMSKKIKVIVMTVCAALLLTAAGCGKKASPGAAQDSVKGLLEGAKELNFEEMEKYTAGDEWTERVKELMEVPAWKNFMEITAPKMTYEIGDVSEEGDTTKVTAKIKYFDASDIYEEAINEYFSQALQLAMTMEDNEEDAEKNAEDIQNILNDILMEKAETMEDNFADMTIVFETQEKDGCRIVNIGDDFNAMLTANLTAVADKLGEDTAESMGDTLETASETPSAAD